MEIPEEIYRGRKIILSLSHLNRCGQIAGGIHEIKPEDIIRVIGSAVNFDFNDNIRIFFLFQNKISKNDIKQENL